MPRPLLIRSETHPYHVTSRCNNKEFFPIPLSEVWEIMLKQLHLEVREQELAVHAFVLMGNHFHLLAQTPKGNLDQVMQRFLRSTSIKIKQKSRTTNHLWGSRYKWSLVESENYYFQVYRYIYQNPLRAGICEKVEDYPFSTLEAAVPFQINDSITVEDKFRWLNMKYEKEGEELIRLGLRKGQFDVSKRNLKTFNEILKN